LANQPSERIQKHNRQQQEYFGAGLKKTMIPGKTNYINRQVDQMVRAGNLSVGDRILEVGCGMGRYTLPLLERGFNVAGLDLSLEQLARLEEFTAGRHNVSLYCSDILDHPAELDGEIDVVLGFFTLHHLHDLPASFYAIYELVKPGGRVLFLEPNALNPLYYVQIFCTPGMTWEGDGGVASMRQGVVFQAMRQAGLVNLKVKRFGFFPPFLTNQSWGPAIENRLERLFGWTKTLPFQIFSGEKP